MRIRKFGPFYAVGVFVRTSMQQESKEETAAISKLDIHFLEHWLGGLIPNRLDRCEWLYIRTQYDSDEHGAFTYMIGHRVWKIEDVPDEMMAIEVSRRRYAVFQENRDRDYGVVEVENEIQRYFATSIHPQRAFATDFVLGGGPHARHYISLK